MTNVGKENTALRIAQAVTNVHLEQTRELISLFWKTDQANKGNQVPIEDWTIVQDLKETILDKGVVTPNATIYEESV
jgi:hypothetical protein